MRRDGAIGWSAREAPIREAARRSRCIKAAAALAALSCLGGAQAASGAPSTERVSLGVEGVQPTGGDSHRPAISSDGRFIVFDSKATNLVAADTNGSSDVFVHDLFLGTTTRVSVTRDGSQGTGNSFVASISDDGMTVAFNSFAADLVSDDGNGTGDIFRHDRATGITLLISRPATGLANGMSLSPAISGDGQRVVFESFASNLGDTNDSNGAKDAFVAYPTAVRTVSHGNFTDDRAANGTSSDPAISDDGQRAVFSSAATDLVSSDTNGAKDIFLAFLGEAASGVIAPPARVSVRSGGTQATGGHSITPAISGNGRFVAFASTATNLVAGDTNGLQDIFVRDIQNNSTSRVSVGEAGAQAIGGHSANPTISDDGRFVAFQSVATNLVPEDTNGVTDVFVHDRSTGTTTRVSLTDAGGQATGGSSTNAVIDDVGRFVAFDSAATNLVVGDTNGVRDIFVRDRGVTAGFSGVWDRVGVRCAGGRGPCRARARLRVLNPGLRTAAASRVHIYLSADRAIDRRDRRLKSIALPRLKPGGKRTIRFRPALEAEISGRFLIARLDATNRVQELDEKNNVVVSKRLRQGRRR